MYFEIRALQYFHIPFPLISVALTADFFSGACPLWQCIWCRFFSETSVNFHSIWTRISVFFHLAVTWTAYLWIFQKFESGLLCFIFGII